MLFLTSVFSQQHTPVSMMTMMVMVVMGMMMITQTWSQCRNFYGDGQRLDFKVNDLSDLRGES